MDSLSSLELDSVYKKSHRVRSWYLYEQYKALERSQIDAAQKLKDKTYQDKILHQELSERRARRNVYDQFGLCHSECGVGVNTESKGCISNVSNEDFLECVCDLKDDDQGSEQYVTDGEDELCQDGSQCSQVYGDEYKNPDELRDDESYSESVASVVENHQSDHNLADEIKEELKFVKKNIAENMNLHLETVKENIECLEKYNEINEAEQLLMHYDSDSVSSYEPKHLTVCKKSHSDYDSSLNTMWTRLVSFAYQVIQLNHGNCYYDYGSQFLTAVLACDVLRRGVNKM